jgi:hypothetical protein
VKNLPPTILTVPPLALDLFQMGVQYYVSGRFGVATSR